MGQTLRDTLLAHEVDVDPLANIVSKGSHTRPYRRSGSTIVRLASELSNELRLFHNALMLQYRQLAASRYDFGVHGDLSTQHAAS